MAVIFDNKISFPQRFQNEKYTRICLKCNGKGYIPVPGELNIYADAVECNDCKGKGYIVVEPQENLPDVIC